MTFIFPLLLPSFLLPRPLPPKSDAHYGVLLFLLCLSESPVNTDYTPPLKTILTQQGNKTAAIVKYTIVGNMNHKRCTDMQVTQRVEHVSASKKCVTWLYVPFYIV